MKLHCLQDRTMTGFTTFGGYWEKGEVKKATFSLTKEDGEQIPVQSKALAFWPDGSIKWSAHTAAAENMGNSVKLCQVPDSSKEKGIDNAIRISENTDFYEVETEKLYMIVPKGENISASYLTKNIQKERKMSVNRVYPVFHLEHREVKQGKTGDMYCTATQEYEGVVTSVKLEEAGPLQAVFCFHGKHVTGQDMEMPFVIRMYLWHDSTELKFVHTFLFDGKEDRDYIKGMGIRFDTCLTGAKYNHQIQFAKEDDVFHEAAVILDSNRPRLKKEVLQAQFQGELMKGEVDDNINIASENLPVWNRYEMFQDSAYHFGIWKQTKRVCCKISGSQGRRAPGVMAVTGEKGGITIGIRDFWQKYPSGLEADGLSEEICKCTAWFYSPMAEAYDFRHYDNRSFPDTCYEGFEEVGASAYGISVTSECQINLQGELPSRENIFAFAKHIQKPSIYVAAPEYYHEKRAFGNWSLVKKETEAEKRLEEQLDLAFDFYHKEIECRDWYGLFDYGDVMHTYDAVRHTWKYDVGGFAWQNTELVPTYWLWLYFLRTGREDVFTLAEAMSRHCSEVDIYHFGDLKGLGSRHNVRHWGCSCKEPRIAMAGHHRFLYYLTGDLRLGDVMEDVKDGDLAMSNNSHSQVTLPNGKVVAGVRSGPDWSSYVSNWMTHYERFLDEDYRKKIETGIQDIAITPFGFASGPDYYYDPETSHLIYHGEVENTPNQHLQICMGGPQIWLEVADLLGDDILKKLLERLGEIYLLSKEDRSKVTKGMIINRQFSWPMFATGVTAFSAKRTGNKELAKETWRILLGDLEKNAGIDGYHPISYIAGKPIEKYQEIPAITTNTTSQWCLNVIMCLEFIPEILNEQGLLKKRRP